MVVHADQFIGAVFFVLLEQKRKDIELEELNRLSKIIDQRLRLFHCSRLSYTENKALTVFDKYRDIFYVVNNKTIGLIEKPIDDVAYALDRNFLAGIPHHLCAAIIDEIGEIFTQTT